VSASGLIVVELDAWLARHATRFRNNSLGRLPGMREAVAAHDYEVIRRFGHDLRGMGGCYGMDEVTRIGGRLEQHAPAARHADLLVGLDELEAELTRLRVVAK
jgi:hypothetical protein